VARELREAAPARIAEIGAGDGAFAVRLAARLPAPAGALFTMLDRQPCAAPTTCRGWRFECVARDVFEWLADPATGPFDAIVANLFLHHFDDRALTELLELVARRTGRFVSCEPRRSQLALAGSRLVDFSPATT